jgi:hypothetical protein
LVASLHHSARGIVGAISVIAEKYIAVEITAAVLGIRAIIAVAIAEPVVGVRVAVTVGNQQGVIVNAIEHINHLVHGEFSIAIIV